MKFLRLAPLWASLLVALALPIRAFAVIAHDAWVVTADFGCYEAAKQNATPQGQAARYAGGWDDSKARSQCHIGGPRPRRPCFAAAASRQGSDSLYGGRGSGVSGIARRVAAARSRTSFEHSGHDRQSSADAR